MPLPVDRWTRELNFLGWVPAEGGQHGRRLTSRHEDACGSSMDRDPRCSSRSDERHRSVSRRSSICIFWCSASARSIGRQSGERRLQCRGPLDQIAGADRAATPTMATYESVIEFTVETAGRYAIRFEGIVPPTIRPVGARRCQRKTAVGSRGRSGCSSKQRRTPTAASVRRFPFDTRGARHARRCDCAHGRLVQLMHAAMPSRTAPPGHPPGVTSSRNPRLSHSMSCPCQAACRAAAQRRDRLCRRVGGEHAQRRRASWIRASLAQHSAGRTARRPRCLAGPTLAECRRHDRNATR